MNGARKFHKATGPAFHEGEVWLSHGGKAKVVIKSVRKYATAQDDHCSNFEVTYVQSNGVEHSKDAWNFQVRYGHQADQYV